MELRKFVLKSKLEFTVGLNAMVANLKDFMLTIFFVFLPLVFYPYIYKFKSNEHLFRILLTILFSIILVTIMSFPINVGGVIYDFRSIPVVVGSLYGGPVVSVFLFFILVTYRWIFGNPHMLLYIFSIIPAFLLIFLTFRKYTPLRSAHKVTIAVILSTLMKLLTITIYLVFTQDLDKVVNNLLDTFQTYIVQGIIIGLCVFLIEKLNKYYYMQDEIIKSEKVKMVSEMAASVAHEIRNPLTSVRGFIQLLGSEELEKYKREYYQKICLDELDRANFIISDYLSLAKPELETNDIINVNDEVKYVSNVLLTFANFNNVELKTHLIKDQNLYIVGNKYKFRQAMINIGKNAIEAMQGGGILEITAVKVTKHVHISISDTGIGMTQEQIERLGTPYYSTKEKGTGLGTMVTFAIIKKMNGKVNIQSEINKGTKYTFIFSYLAQFEIKNSDL